MNIGMNNYMIDLIELNIKATFCLSKARGPSVSVIQSNQSVPLRSYLKHKLELLI